MASLNKVMIIGNLGKDPEVTYTPSGSAVTKFSVATTERWKDKIERRKMPKLKTHKGAAKRFRKSASGKIKRSKAYANHILTKKTTKRKRKLRHEDFVSKDDKKRISKMIPYA